MPSEVLHVCASSPRRIAEDPGEVVSDILNLLARLSPGWPSLQLSHSQLGVPQVRFQSPCRCVLPHQSAKGAVSAAAQNSATVVLMGSQFWHRCFHRVGMWCCSFGPQGMGPWSHRLSSALSLLTLCLSCCPLVFLLWRVPSTSGYVALLSGRLTRHSLREVADSSQESMHLDNPVPDEFPGPARTSLVLSCCMSRLSTSSLLQSSVFSGCHGPPPRVSPGVHIVAGTGYGSSHRSSTRCPSADGTTSLKSFARTLMKRRVIALTGRSRTPRRSQTPPGLRAEGRWPWLRSLVAFLAGPKWLDERLVRVAFVLSTLLLFSFFPGFFNSCHADTGNTQIRGHTGARRAPTTDGLATVWLSLGLSLYARTRVSR